MINASSGSIAVLLLKGICFNDRRLRIPLLGLRHAVADAIGSTCPWPLLMGLHKPIASCCVRIVVLPIDAENNLICRIESDVSSSFPRRLLNKLDDDDIDDDLYRFEAGGGMQTTLA